MKHFLLILLILGTGNTAVFSQQKIEPMLCEGPLPSDLKKSLSEIINNAASSDFTKQNLLGIYDIFGSGNVVYGNAAWRMVDRIGRQIIAQNHLDSNVHFYLLRSGFYNAFATDQGYIFATTGMLSQASNEDEIAFVLCHELSHYLLKHNLMQHERVKEGIKTLRKKLKKTRSQEKKFSSLDMFLKEYYEFSRAHEFQADSLGLILFRNAGYNELNALASMKKLQYANPIFYQHTYNSRQLEPDADSGFHRMLSRSCNLRQNLSKAAGMNVELKSDTVSRRAASDSIYLTHPDWLLRHDRLKDMMKGSGYAQKTVPIPDAVWHQCMSESFVHEFRNRNFFKALAYLLILEEKTGPSEHIQKWKGICLSAVYFAYFDHKKVTAISNGMCLDTASYLNGLVRHLITWDQNALRQVSVYYNQVYADASEIDQLSRFYLKQFKDSGSVKPLPVLRDSIALKMCDTLVRYASISRPFFKRVNEWRSTYSADSTLLVWQKSDGRLHYNNNGDVFGTINTRLPKRYVSSGPDSILMVAPDLLVRPSRQNKRYRNPLVLSDKKEFFAGELLHWGAFNDLFYKQINFDDKVNLSTESYNQFFLSRFIVSDLAMAEENDEHCPLSILFTDRIIQQTGCSKLQLVQVIHTNNKSLINVGTILYEVFAFPFNAVTFTDIGGIMSGINRSTVVLNIVIDLKTTNLDFIAVYENSLIFSYDSISATALRVQSDTKRYLIHE